MPDQFDWDFGEPRDAKAEIRAAVRYLLSGVSGSARGDIVREIIEIVRQLASGLPPGQSDPWTMICRADSPCTTSAARHTAPAEGVPSLASMPLVK